MPTCLKCNNDFASKIVVEGRERKLSNRKYCLECSPFGEHNTKKLTAATDNARECTCGSCGKTYVYKPGTGTGPNTCWSCRTRARRIELKGKAIQHLGGSCKLCGYNKCIEALVFHHTNEDDKAFGIANKWCMSWESLKREINKCVLLCANCHSEVHAGIVNLGL